MKKYGYFNETLTQKPTDTLRLKLEKAGVDKIVIDTEETNGAELDALLQSITSTDIIVFISPQTTAQDMDELLLLTRYIFDKEAPFLFLDVFIDMKTLQALADFHEHATHQKRRREVLQTRHERMKDMVGQANNPAAQRIQLDDFDTYYNMYNNGELSQQDIADELGVSQVTISRRIRERRAKA